jgi:ketosteroid isomerase-like protein
MSQENVEIVRSIFARWEHGDFSAGATDLDQHVVFVSSPDFPAFGIYLGRDAVGGFMRDFLRQWEWTTFEAERLRAVGDTVIADVLQRGKGRTSGAESTVRFFMLFTFRGKWVIRYETVMHETEALEALGLSEQDADADS